jgi:hypothetical protein
VQCFKTIQASIDNRAAFDSPQALIASLDPKLQQLSLNNDRLNYNYCKPMMNPTHFDYQNLWLLKPIDLNRGRGIHVFNNLERLFELVKEMSSGIVDDEKV